MILIAVRDILKLMSDMYWIMNPKNAVAYGMKSIFLSLMTTTLTLLSIASIALVLSYNDLCKCSLYLPLVVFIESFNHVIV